MFINYAKYIDKLTVTVIEYIHKNCIISSKRQINLPNQRLNKKNEKKNHNFEDSGQTKIKVARYQLKQTI